MSGAALLLVVTATAGAGGAGYSVADELGFEPSSAPREVVHDEVVAEVEILAEGDPTEVWYGWKTLVLDGSILAAASLAGILGRDSAGFVAGSVITGLIGISVSGGAMHFAHGEWGKGTRSILIRGGATTIGSGMFMFGLVRALGSGEESGGFIAIGGVMIGVAGVLASMILDAVTGRTTR